ncbi:MAG TPA: maltotransferase domain-containing protein [Kofleriaceae bacterium]|nr:maltotransferase domain-containing protein [Kofleriaceae bacterium]
MVLAELDGRRRVVIAAMRPDVAASVQGGDALVKRTVGEALRIEADLLIDGHDRIAAVVHVRHSADPMWREIPMTAVGPHAPDRFAAEVTFDRLGVWEYKIEAWRDALATWRHGIERKLEAGQDVTLERAMEPSGERKHTTTGPARRVLVERERARRSAWYELFPRSFGTLRDVIALLPYIEELGFDILYLPPIHPIGRAHRKGKDNATTAAPGDPGSPWAIGAREGGHEAIHPELGTLADFAALVEAAHARGIELALDIAFQASPDHPWVAQHPSWFVRRPDGSIQYAENPPKKYQDVYPFDFESDDWRALWEALAGVFLTWAARGVRVFRVDNPHTKPIGFWRWCLARVREEFPDAIFLSEAFTRPLMLEELAEIGFSQSYTYFTWRTTARELRAYCEELTGKLDLVRPCFWPTTPDILPEHLQLGGRPAFLQRAILASTLTASWGIYGPAFELGEARAIEGKEEYASSEKYERRVWRLDAPHSLRHAIARLNAIRREHPALANDRSLRFHDTDSDAILCYSKRDGDDLIVCVVSTDPFHARAGWITLDLEDLPEQGFQVHDLLGGGRYLWSGARNYVELTPEAPGHVLAIRRRSHREEGFEYYL